MQPPSDHSAWITFWQEHRQTLVLDFQQGKQEFIPHVLPELALALPVGDVLDILGRRLGAEKLERALTPGVILPSPLEGRSDSRWIRTANLVGVNVRTVGSFWHVVHYILTVPRCQRAVHLLPIWEPGVVDSLYGMAGWQLNREFFSPGLAAARPALDTVDKQLLAVVNVLHALGRVVGMDVIPHTDRFSEIVLANPHFFEWLQRDETRIIDHSADLHRRVQALLFDFLLLHGGATPALTLPDSPEAFFADGFGEEQRRLALFGAPADYEGRQARRRQLVHHLYEYGYEPAPATMAPPYRGLVVDERPESRTTDAEGRTWVDYRIEHPQAMSRVFGPLTRYKLYERRDDNRDWAIDFQRPRPAVWDYVRRKYADMARAFHLDFMRGDMSHVQMRPGGVPHPIDEYYDIHREVKHFIQREKPYFGYFAESFLAPPGFMAYGDEVDHLEQSDADATLGDLQSMHVGSPRFLAQLRWYLDILATRAVAPSFTVMTGDKDDPRFDEFYLAGNEVRLFLAFLLPDMPSYMGLGFETRDPHPEPAPNEHYTKLYVFRISEGPKGTRGPYVWGKNTLLFRRLTRIRQLAEELLPILDGHDTHWLLPPDPTAGRKTVAWTQAGDPQWLFVANLDTENDAHNTKIPAISGLPDGFSPQFHFSTHEIAPENDRILPFNGRSFQLDRLAPGEGRAYRLAE